MDTCIAIEHMHLPGVPIINSNLKREWLVKPEFCTATDLIGMAITRGILQVVILVLAVIVVVFSSQCYTN